MSQAQKLPWSVKMTSWVTDLKRELTAQFKGFKIFGTKIRPRWIGDFWF